MHLVVGEGQTEGVNWRGLMEPCVDISILVGTHPPTLGNILEGEGNHSTSVISHLLCTFTKDNNNNITRHIHSL